MNQSPALPLLLQAALSTRSKRIGFIHAFAHPLLTELNQAVADLDIEQSFKPAIDELKQLGLSTNKLSGSYDLILLIPSKDKLQSLGWMATAFAHLVDGGKLLLACENQYGAKSYDSALKKIAGISVSNSKSKCRLCSAKKTSALDIGLQQAWIEAALPKRLDSHGLWAQAGLFSWKSADVGSKLLLEHLPEMEGEGLDLCCGYGLLSHSILHKSANIKQLHMFEAESLALDCAKKNVKAFEQVSFYHLDATKDSLPKHLDWIVCNPPFHTGQSRDVELGQTIVTCACEALKYNGNLYVVANRQLPYEKILKAQLREVEIIAVGNGFKVIRGRK
ncbi:MAG: methyltransferase [Ghiorsea sp.]